MTPSELAEVKQVIGEALEEKMEPIVKEISTFRKILFGNGEAGLCERLRSIEEFVKNLKSTPKITWVLVSQFVTWGLVFYFAWRK
jgi:hypothetical protein